MDGILLINKEKGMTSHDVVNKLRRILKTKKIGHCGTLDPDATGLLVVAVNKATKIIQFLDKSDKTYLARLSLGISTDTYDASGKITGQKEFVGLPENYREIFNRYIGNIKQIPPIYSAIKIDGKKLYQYAFNNQEITIPEREVTIYQLDIENVIENLIDFKVKCSKGTYIRSLCYDLAFELGYPGHMSNLIRLKAGSFNLENAQSISELENGVKPVFLTINQALTHLPKYKLDDENIVYHGKKIKSDINELVAMVDKNDNIIAVYGPDGTGYLKSVRGLW